MHDPHHDPFYFIESKFTKNEFSGRPLKLSCAVLTATAGATCRTTSFLEKVAVRAGPFKPK